MSVTEAMEEEEEEEEEEETQHQEQQQRNLPKEVAEITEPVQQEEYSWPVIRYDVPPVRTYHFAQQFRNSSNPNNFLKGVKCSEDNTLRRFTLEVLQFYGVPDNGSDDHVNVCSLSAGEDSFMANLVVDEGESVYDYCWYPYMTASDPVTCVFATTSSDHPIHLWDATSGQLHCTYRAYDAMDEITASFSIAFNPTGTKIFAGYNKSLRVFDIHRPGREFKQYSTLQGNREGQSSVISAIAFSPHAGMLAMGSYSQTTAIYREDNMELLYILHGQEGGINHVQFSKDGNYLYTGGRKDPYMLCWDIRNTVETVYKLYRSTEHTNQRVLFDIEPFGQHLATVGEDGLVHIYDLQTGQWISSFQAALLLLCYNTTIANTVNSFSFHPFLPMAATTSGQRRFGIPDDCNEDFSLTGDENCASVWSFYASTMENASDIKCGDTNSLSNHENLDQDP